MDSTGATFKLDSSQLDYSLLVLKKELQTNQPTRSQKIFFIILKTAIYGFIISLASSFLLFLLLSVFNLNVNVFGIIAGALVVIGALCLLLIPIIYLLNISLIRKLWRQSRLVKNLGLKEAIDAPWRALRRQHKFRHWLPMIIISLVSAIFIFLGILLFGKKIEEILVCSAPLLLGLMLISVIFMIRAKQRLEFVSGLQSTFSRYKEGFHENMDNPVEIPLEEYNTVAKIERAQIIRERRESILDLRDDQKMTTYTIQKSAHVREAQSSLDPSQKILVQQRIDDLRTDPLPSDSQKEPEGDKIRLHIPETSIDITYTVDKESCRIRIHDLEISMSGAPSAGEEKGQLNE